MKKYKNQDGKIIGIVSGDTFSKKVKKSKHLFRKLDAWGLDKSVLDEIICNGVQIIKIHEVEENKDYIASVKDFIEKGVVDDFGYSPQVFLPLVYFHKDNVN